MASGGGASQLASLYVGDLNPDVTEAMLYEIFNSVGPVASIRVCRDNITRRSLGYSYVNFHNVEDAERAMDTLNYSNIKGRSCRIMWSQRDATTRNGGKGSIYVKNLDKDIDNKVLYDTFSLFGNIFSCKVASDPVGNSYGYGFVHYETEDSAKQAIEKVNGMQIGEKTVQVTEFVKRSERDPPDATNYTNLYVKCFPGDWVEEKLKEEFGKFGTVTAVAIRGDGKGRRMAFVNFETTAEAQECVSQMHLKDVRSPEEIGRAKEEGREEETGPDGHPAGRLYCQRALSKAERAAELRDKFPTNGAKAASPTVVNLYVKNLDENMDPAQLRQLFEPFGAITSAAVPQDERGKSKGFGFVAFASPDEATRAVTEMHLKVVKGKPLYVGLAEKKEVRQERLKQRYSAGADRPSGDGKGPASGGKGMGGMGGMGMMEQMGVMGMQASMAPQMGMMGGTKGGVGPHMGMMVGKGGPQMMGMFPQMMASMVRPGMMPPGMVSNGMRPMMSGPQMMGMMRQGMTPGILPGVLPGVARPQMPGGTLPGGAGLRTPQQGCPPAQPRPQQGGPLSVSALAAAPPSVQKQMIGERLFQIITKSQPQMAGKITGMMLEMSNSDLIILLESEARLKAKVDEALRILGCA